MASSEAALLTELLAAEAYFNVHSAASPGGEIRAFPAAVPEPETGALLIAGFGLIRRCDAASGSHGSAGACQGHGGRVGLRSNW